MTAALRIREPSWGLRREVSRPGNARGLTAVAFSRVWEGEDGGEDFHDAPAGRAAAAAGEGREGRQRERGHPGRRQAVGALLARYGRGRVPNGGTNGDGHHNQQALAGALARARGPPEGVGSVATPGCEQPDA